MILLLQVTSKTIKQYVSDSDADVLVRGEPVGYNDGVIYTVYNTTNGTDFCSKFCTALNLLLHVLML